MTSSVWTISAAAALAASSHAGIARGETRPSLPTTVPMQRDAGRAAAVTLSWPNPVGWASVVPPWGVNVSLNPFTMAVAGPTSVTNPAVGDPSLGCCGLNRLNQSAVNDVIVVSALGNPNAPRTPDATAASSYKAQTGAISSTFVNGATYFGRGFSQSTTNSTSVFNDQPASVEGAISGPGASVSASASGAISTLSSRLVGDVWSSDGYYEVLEISGNVTQTAVNQGPGVTNSLVSPVSVGAVSGVGASISSSATGATVSLSDRQTDFGTPDGGQIFGIWLHDSLTQSATNSAPIVSAASLNPASMTGLGSSASISASGATVTLSTTFNSARNGASSWWAETDGLTRQLATNSGSIATDGHIFTSGLTGAGASVSISAVGATAFIGMSALGIDGGAFVGFPAYYGASQTATNGGNVVNGGAGGSTITSGELATGASVSISASGSISAVAMSRLGVTADMYSLAFQGRSFPQQATNTGEIHTVGAINPDSSPDMTGDGASASISATGAATAVTNTIVLSDPFEGNDPYADNQVVLTQRAENGGAIETRGQINAGSLTGTGSSVSIAATGAAASYSSSAVDFQRIYGTFFWVWNFGQTASNTAPVASSGMIGISSLGSTGTSASVVAVGAEATIDTATIQQSNGFYLTPFFAGGLTQTATNSNGQGTAAVAASIVASGSVAIGSVSGLTASAAVASLGASSSFRLSAIGQTGGVLETYYFVPGYGFYDPVGLRQASTNASSVASGGTLVIGDISGLSASASLSAAGASTLVGVSSIGQADGSVSTIGFFPTPTQSALNSSAITATGRVVTGDLVGMAASASLSAAGATAAFTFSSIGQFGGTTNGPELRAGITQTATNSGPAMVGTDDNAPIFTLGDLSGTGASATMSAVGAAASLSAAAIGWTGGTINPAIVFGAVSQQVQNTGPVSVGTPGTPAMITATGLSGVGASVSIGATGAAASVSLLQLGNADLVAPMAFASGATLSQQVSNTGNVTTRGIIDGAPALTQSNSSLSISATGAAASLSSTSMSISTFTAGRPAMAGPPITQQAITQGDGSATGIISNSGTITAGALSGTGASASIGATGAAASIAVTSVSDRGASASMTFPSITQSAVNQGSAVRNTGTITVGSLGVAASASISAVGASASVSYRSVR